MNVLDRLRRAVGLYAGPSQAVAPIEEKTLDWPEDLPMQIQTVEEASLEIYRRHGLPTANGSYYAKGPDAPWAPLPADLTPEDKWTLLQRAPEGQGWRFGERASLGRRSPIEEVRRASTLLQTCDSLRRKLDGKEAVTQSDIADAILLGTASGLILQSRKTTADTMKTVPAHTPLHFTTVEDDSATG